MKVLKAVLVLAGLAAVIGAGVWLFRFGWDMQEIIGAAQRYDSARVIANPVTTTAMIAGLGALAGLLIGIGLGLPPRTAGQVRRATLDEVNAGRSDAIANRAVGGSDAAPAVDRRDAPELEGRDGREDRA